MDWNRFDEFEQLKCIILDNIVNFAFSMHFSTKFSTHCVPLWALVTENVSIWP